MKIVIPGGSGQIGTILARHFHQQGHTVTVLRRAPKPAAPTNRPAPARPAGRPR